jgi:hypothetical protein
MRIKARYAHCTVGLAAMAFALAVTPEAHALEVGSLPTLNQTWTFDDAPHSLGVYFDGSAGYDIGKGYGYNGFANDVAIWAWQPNAWNAINVEFHPHPGEWGGKHTYCDVNAAIQTNPGAFADAYLDIWEVTKSGPWVQLAHWPIGGTNMAWVAGNLGSVDVSAVTTDDVLMDFGWWGTGSVQWLRADEVQVQCWNAA